MNDVDIKDLNHPLWPTNKKTAANLSSFVGNQRDRSQLRWFHDKVDVPRIGCPYPMGG